MIVCLRGQRRYYPLNIILGVAFLMEMLVAWLYYSKIKFVWIYHLYAIFEYTLFCLFFMRAMSPALKRVVAISILMFALASGVISYWYYQFDAYPGVNINMEGILLCILCTYTLMTLDVRQYNAIQKHPDFWISLGLILYYGGTFFSNGLYSYLFTIDPEQAKKLFGTINKPLNLTLYGCFTIGFICALLPQKSTIRLF